MDLDAAAANPLLGAAEVALYDLHADDRRVYDCDIQDGDKPHMVTEYTPELFQYYKDSEVVSLT